MPRGCAWGCVVEMFGGLLAAVVVVVAWAVAPYVATAVREALP